MLTVTPVTSVESRRFQKSEQLEVQTCLREIGKPRRLSAPVPKRSFIWKRSRELVIVNLLVRCADKKKLGQCVHGLLVVRKATAK